MNHKALLVIFAGIVTLSIAHYFLVSLPAHNAEMLKLSQQRLVFEQEQYKTQQQEKEENTKKQEQEKLQKEIKLQGCLRQAEITRDGLYKSNETVGSNGKTIIPWRVVDAADRQMKLDKETCFRQYGQ
jgi:hypothetical protein